MYNCIKANCNPLSWNKKGRIILEIFTVKEAQEYLKVPRAQIYALVGSGWIPSFRVGKHIRIPKDGLDKWIKNQIANN